MVSPFSLTTDYRLLTTVLIFPFVNARLTTKVCQLSVVRCLLSSFSLLAFSGSSAEEKNLLRRAVFPHGMGRFGLENGNL